MFDCRFYMFLFFFFSSRRRHTRLQGDWSSDVCSSDLRPRPGGPFALAAFRSCRLFVRTGLRRRRLPAVTAAWSRLGGPFAQIGRASCRERVEISVVAVAVKKTRGVETDGGSWMDRTG